MVIWLYSFKAPALEGNCFRSSASILCNLSFATLKRGNLIIFIMIMRIELIHNYLNRLRFPTYILMGMCCSLFLAPLFAQQPTPKKPVFLEQLEIEFNQKIDFPVKKFKRQYQSRIFDPGLKKEGILFPQNLQ